MYSKQQFLFVTALKKEKLYDILVANHAIIAGGAIRAVFAREYVSDYDVFFKNLTDYGNFLAAMKSQEGYELTFESDTAKSFTKEDTKVQVISFIFGTAKEIIEQFDYTVCMGAYDFEANDFVLAEDFLSHVARKELYYNVNGKYPISSLFRLQKYFKKGYKIPGVEVIKLALAVNNLKMNSYMDLRQQLQGIDTLFLKELTDKMLTPEYAEKKYDFTEFMQMVDGYANSLLDNLFD